MTTSPSPVKPRMSPLAAYDQARREQATIEGKPILRTFYPQVERISVDTPMVVVSLRDGGVVAAFFSDGQVTRWSGGTALDAVAARLESSFGSGAALGAYSTVFVFDTPKTAAKVAAKMGQRANVRNAKEDARWAAHRRLTHFVYQGVGWGMFSLTTALTARFYPPVGVDTGSIADWAAAFSDSDRKIGVDAEGMRVLALFVSEGDRNDELPSPSRHEVSAMRSTVWSALSARCQAFDATTKMVDAVESRLSFDPLLAERNVLSGLATRVRFVGSSRFMILGNCNFKEGESVSYLDAARGHVYSCAVKKLELGESGLLATAMWEKASPPVAPGTELFLVKTPFDFFSMSRAGSSGHAWTPQDVGPRVAGRSVPLSIVLAGAPTSD